MTDPHGNVQVQAFLLLLVRDPQFPEAVNDIVIETASSRYQDAIDRFVRGDDVERAVLRKAWEDHTVANSLGIQAEELIQAVRAVMLHAPRIGGYVSLPVTFQSIGTTSRLLRTAGAGQSFATAIPPT